VTIFLKFVIIKLEFVLFQGKCVKYWPEPPEPVKTYEVYRGSLTVKYITVISNPDYDLREFEITKTEMKVCMHARYWGSSIIVTYIFLLRINALKCCDKVINTSVLLKLLFSSSIAEKNNLSKKKLTLWGCCSYSKWCQWFVKGILPVIGNIALIFLIYVIVVLHCVT